ncbi:MAG: hypothetical protein RLZZ385_1764 [Pseudomonadota bacterium]
MTTPTAGLLRRLGALLYDSFLVVAIWMLIGYTVQLFVGPDTSTLVDGRVQTDPVLDALLFTLMLGSCVGFYAWFWCRGGQTLGMLAWRIKVVNHQGGLISLPQALLRFVLAWPAFLCLGMGYLWLYVDPNGDALHDRLSRTRVIVLPRPAKTGK